jgi:hypothetical protein
MARPPRIPHFPYTGLYRYFLTFCTFKRRRFFTSPLTVQRRLRSFGRLREKKRLK